MKLLILLTILCLYSCTFLEMLKTQFRCRELNEDCDVNYPHDCCGGLMCRAKRDINLRRNPAKCYSQ